MLVSCRRKHLYAVSTYGNRPAKRSSSSPHPLSHHTTHTQALAKHSQSHTQLNTQPGLEALLEAPAGAGEFSVVYKQQSSALDEYIEAQPFAAIKQLLFDILLGQRELKSAWNPALDQGTIMVRGLGCWHKAQLSKLAAASFFIVNGNRNGGSCAGCNTFYPAGVAHERAAHTHDPSA